MRSRALEPKVLIGVALMVAATGIGALSMQQASRRVSVWQLDSALAAGTRITAADVHIAQVAMEQGVGTYATASTAVVGRVLLRDLASLELVPRAALSGTLPERDHVSLPMEAQHLPPALRRGQRVDVWLTPQAEDGAPTSSRRVLAAALVDAVNASDVSGRPGVVLAVPREQVAMLVSALRQGDIDLVGVGA